jgi:hypothetical protein
MLAEILVLQHAQLLPAFWNQKALLVLATERPSTVSDLRWHSLEVKEVSSAAGSKQFDMKLTLYLNHTELNNEENSS